MVIKTAAEMAMEETQEFADEYKAQRASDIRFLESIVNKKTGKRAFSGRDLNKLLRQGLIEYAASAVEDYQSAQDFKQQIRKELHSPLQAATTRDGQVSTRRTYDFNADSEGITREWTPFTDGIEAVANDLGPKASYLAQIAKKVAQHPAAHWGAAAGLTAAYLLLPGCGNTASTGDSPALPDLSEFEPADNSQPQAKNQPTINEQPVQPETPQPENPAPEAENQPNDEGVKAVRDYANQAHESAKNMGIAAEKQAVMNQIKQGIQKLEDQLSRAYTASPARDFDSRDTKNLRGTIGFQPSFLAVGKETSQLHDGHYVEGRVFTSLEDFIEGPLGRAIAEIKARAEQGTFFKGKPGEYEVPFAGKLSISAMFDTLNYNPVENEALSRQILAPGLFAEIAYADSDSQRIVDSKIGGRLFSLYQSGNDSLQADLKLGVQYRDSRRSNSNLIGFGPFAELNASAHLGEGFTLFANGGVSFLDNMIKGQGHEIDADNLELNGGITVAWSPSQMLQFYAALEGTMNWFRYDDEAKQTGFNDDVYKTGRVEAGAQIVPFAQVYSLDKDKRLFTPLGSLYFNLKAFAEQTPYQPLNWGVAGETGFKF